MDRVYTTDIDEMLKDGYSRKFGAKYLRTINAELANPIYEKEYVKWAHRHGFFAESAYAYGLNDDNYNNFLCDYDYYMIWPLNGWQKIWINDKLTLKYMLANTEFDSFMPAYYYYNSNGNMIALIDNPYRDKEYKFEYFLQVLKENGIMACKPCNGTTSLGFFKLSCANDKYYKDDNEIDVDNLEKLIKSQTNYIFTEYIIPSKQFKIYSPLIHTLRLVVVNENGYNPKIIGGYLRIPNTLTGSANYVVLAGENITKYNIFIRLNIETGEYGPGKLTYVNRVVDAEMHPELNIPLVGKIDNYDELKSIVIGVASRLNAVSYFGFDIGITDKGFKCMEINSHPGIKYMQIFTPFFENPTLYQYYNERIDKILKLDSDSKKKRENLV